MRRKRAGSAWQFGPDFATEYCHLRSHAGAVGRSRVAGRGCGPATLHPITLREGQTRVRVGTYVLGDTHKTTMCPVKACAVARGALLPWVLREHEDAVCTRRIRIAGA